ncbi:hypothetical protein JIN84_00140 [Luteolibacter yonseiensis]|uniref:Alpha/beta hydrolase n=1 Tax=Luteolibacter yonseiensis TaxID=1144680 RepID=A0A934R2A5_9BACT|nr:hypothetical protein [Luteolibacter yonseiensis]MBK1814015.1 hypothetical protein [Luteolibacter yonseiensis]
MTSRSHHSILRSLPVLLAAVTFSCAPHQQHQANWPNVKVSTPDGGKAATTNLIAAVEFDEQGDLWDAHQVDQATKMLRNTPKPPLVITFIHGWRHDPREDDSDLIQFHKFVADLDKQGLAFSVRGVYIGWRGASIDEKLGFVSTIPAVFSFWDRKQATDRMSNIRLSQTLSKISTTAWKAQGKSVMMGHSFGGRILERTVGMGMAAQSGNWENYRPLANLVVLVNPASESLNARVIKRGLSGWNKDYPLVVAVGAKDDGANGQAWTAGYWLGLRTKTRYYESTRDKQSSYLADTVTNDPRQFTHVLENGTETRKAAIVRTEEVYPLATGSEGETEQWKLNLLDTHHQPDVDHVLDSKAYWVFQVPTTVLSGHSGDRLQGGIFNKPTTDLLHGIFRSSLTKQAAGSAPKVPIPVKEPVSQNGGTGTAEGGVAGNPPQKPDPATAPTTDSVTMTGN